MHAFPRISASACGLLLSGLLFSQASCITVTDRIIPGPSFRHEQNVMLKGPPQVTLSAHPDHQGWTVTVTQPLNRHVELIRSQREEHYYYYVNPFVFPAGAFACPSSAWGWFWTAFATLLNPEHQIEKQQALRDFTWTSCLMALMIARSRPEVVNVESVVEHRNEPDTRQALDGRVTISWQGSPGDTGLSYPLQAGRALVRLAHIATALRQNHQPLSSVSRGTIQLSAWHQGHLLQRWPLEVTAKELEAAEREEIPVIAPRSRWPRQLVFKIISENMPETITAPEGAFLRLLVQHGVAAVASDEQQILARHELERNLDSIVEDNSVMGPGYWKAASILLSLTGSLSNGNWALAVSCISIRTREVLARLDVEAGPDNEQGALDVALLRFQNVLLSLTAEQIR